MSETRPLRAHRQRGSTCAPAPSSRRWRLLLRLMLLGGSVLVALLITEIGLRLFVPVTDRLLNIWDPVVGVRRAPDQQGRYVRGDSINAPYHFNAHGWNHPVDYETEPKPGTRRVCVVGDSYVEALQVPYEQSFFALAQQRMSRPERPVEWYAFGNSGYGTTQEYMLIRHYVLDYRPDVVVMLFAHNDPVDCSPYLVRQERYYARFLLDDQGGLVLLPARPWRPSLLRRLLGKSALVRYLRIQHGLFRPPRPPLQARMRDFLREDAGGAPLDVSLIGKLSPETRQERTWALIEAILRRARTECEQRGAVFALAFRGSRARIEAAFKGRPYTPPPKHLDPYCLSTRLEEMGQEFLEPITRRLGIPYLDLTPALIAKENATGRRHDIPNDGHFSPIGHAAVAEAMADWIETLWPPQEPPDAPPP